MRSVHFTVAKIDPKMWEKIKNGEKKYEVRTEPFEGSHVVFVDANNLDCVLGVCKYFGNYNVDRFVGMPSFGTGILCSIAQCTKSEFDKYFGNSRYFYIYEVEPIAIPRNTFSLGDAIKVFTR